MLKFNICIFFFIFLVLLINFSCNAHSDRIGGPYYYKRANLMTIPIEPDPSYEMTSEEIADYKDAYLTVYYNKDGTIDYYEKHQKWNLNNGQVEDKITDIFKYFYSKDNVLEFIEHTNRDSNTTRWRIDKNNGKLIKMK